MKFVIIFGPSAVGKMSVGKALAEKTALKLYYNHMSIEAVRPVFDFGTPEFNPFDVQSNIDEDVQRLLLPLRRHRI